MVGAGGRGGLAAHGHGVDADDGLSADAVDFAYTPGATSTPITIHLDDETFVRLGAGRVSAEDAHVKTTGDSLLAAQVLKSFAVTP